jgi:hypothetical protein
MMRRISLFLMSLMRTCSCECQRCWAALHVEGFYLLLGSLLYTVYLNPLGTR